MFESTSWPSLNCAFANLTPHTSKLLYGSSESALWDRIKKQQNAEVRARTPAWKWWRCYAIFSALYNWNIKTKPEVEPPRRGDIPYEFHDMQTMYFRKFEWISRPLNHRRDDILVHLCIFQSVIDTHTQTRCNLRKQWQKYLELLWHRVRNQDIDSLIWKYCVLWLFSE